MPDIAVIGSVSTGHDTCGPATAIEGSPTMFVNGKAVVRVGDRFSAHSGDGYGSHNGIVSEGSSIVFVDDKPVAFVGCAIADGGCNDSHKIATGDNLINIEQ